MTLRRTFSESSKLSFFKMKKSFVRRLQTAPSGPLLPLYARPSQLFTHGEGCYLVDSTGQRFIDFTSGIAVNALGHNHPKVVEIISKQAGRLIHLSNLYHNEYAQGLAQMIIDSLEKDPKMDKGQVFFSNSGTEANEGLLCFSLSLVVSLLLTFCQYAGAFKFARKYAKEIYPNRPEKYEVVSFSSAFHGRTFAALSATPNAKYQKPFLPLMAGFKSLPFNDVASLDKIGENVCAVIVEPVQGEGGIHAASKEFLRALRKKCDDVGALLIYDEIQVRLARRLKDIELFLIIPTFYNLVRNWKNWENVWISKLLSSWMYI